MSSSAPGGGRRAAGAPPSLQSPGRAADLWSHAAYPSSGPRRPLGALPQRAGGSRPPLAQLLAEGTPATAATAQSAAGPPSCERLGRTLAPPEGRAAGGRGHCPGGRACAPKRGHGCFHPGSTAPWGEPGHPILTARTEPAPDGPHSGRLAVFLSTLNVGSAERVRALSVSGSLDGMDTQPAHPWGPTPRLPGGGGRGTQWARSTCSRPEAFLLDPSFSLVPVSKAPVPVSKAPGRSVGAFPTVWVGLVASCAGSGPSVPCTAGVRRRGPVGSRDTWV